MPRLGQSIIDDNDLAALFHNPDKLAQRFFAVGSRLFMKEKDKFASLAKLEANNAPT